jgi:hypothetical protein
MTYQFSERLKSELIVLPKVHGGTKQKEVKQEDHIIATGINEDVTPLVHRSGITAFFRP